MKNIITQLLTLVSLFAAVLAVSQTTNYGSNSGTQGSENSFFGFDSGKVTTGNFNSFYGYKSGQNNTTANYNTFIGHFSGSNNTTGDLNVFVGNSSGYNSTTGVRNVFMGHYSAHENTTGSRNVFIGFYSGRKNNSGNSNVFLGNYSGYKNSSGKSNVFLGSSSGSNNTLGNYNTYLGFLAGNKNTTGGMNVFVGSESGKNTISGIGNVFLGYKSGYSETGNNKLYIENSDAQIPLIYGDFATDQVGINTKIVPTGYSFAVKGKMIAEKIKVQVYPWADYVFKDDYKLPSLKEVAKHIKEKGYLVNMPSAEKVHKEGIYVGEMQAKLLEKIEELTLYTLAQEKKLEQQEKENKELKVRLDKIEALLLSKKQ